MTNAIYKFIHTPIVYLIYLRFVVYIVLVAYVIAVAPIVWVSKSFQFIEIMTSLLFLFRNKLILILILILIIIYFKIYELSTCQISIKMFPSWLPFLATSRDSTHPHGLVVIKYQSSCPLHLLLPNVYPQCLLRVSVD